MNVKLVDSLIQIIQSLSEQESGVGWVEVRNPTVSMLVLGYAIANPTYDIKVDFPDLI